MERKPRIYSIMEIRRSMSRVPYAIEQEKWILRKDHEIWPLDHFYAFLYLTKQPFRNLYHLIIFIQPVLLAK